MRRFIQTNPFSNYTPSVSGVPTYGQSAMTNNYGALSNASYSSPQANQAQMLGVLQMLQQMQNRRQNLERSQPRQTQFAPQNQGAMQSTASGQGSRNWMEGYAHPTMPFVRFSTEDDMAAYFAGAPFQTILPNGQMKNSSASMNTGMPRSEKMVERKPNHHPEKGWFWNNTPQGAFNFGRKADQTQQQLERQRQMNAGNAMGRGGAFYAQGGGRWHGPKTIR